MLARAAAAGVSAFGLDFTARQYLKSEQLDSSCTLIDVAICKAKGFLEGPHFLLGLGDRIDEGMAAIERMKRTAAREVKVEWRSSWEQRESQLSGRYFWVRRGAFESPIAELLPEGARNATVWEVRGTAPVDCQRELADANADVMLPINTVWLGLTPVDRCIDTVVRLLNVSPSQVPVDNALGKQTAIVILPDFGGEFCKRTMPLAELVSARLPAASVFLLEMPLRGTRKPPGYLGALPSVHDMMLMGCAIIEESRSLIGWLKISGFDHVTLCGMSMGGQMAALTACCEPPIVPRLCLLMPSHSAEANWTDGGVMGMNCGMSVPQLKPYLRQATSIEAYPPCKAESALIVAARYDGYVPLWSSEKLRDSLATDGVPVKFRVISGGHVSGFLAHQHDFADAVVGVTLGESE
ncbi:unnamed protein product [Polarella glacialis]|nr:unnamed protein product [Polarella glacialis]